MLEEKQIAVRIFYKNKYIKCIKTNYYGIQSAGFPLIDVKCYLSVDLSIVSF